MNDIAIPASFEQKMKERIKESIGELITDDELSTLVIKGIDEAFFRTIITQKPGWGGGTTESPCLMTTILTDLLTEQVKIAAEAWLKDNQEMVTDMLEEVIKDGVGRAALNALSSQFQDQLITLQMNMQQQLSQP